MDIVKEGVCMNYRGLSTPGMRRVLTGRRPAAGVWLTACNPNDYGLSWHIVLLI